jgi:uncharacterized protein with ParB-like and HNH nuclease domain
MERKGLQIGGYREQSIEELFTRRDIQFSVSSFQRDYSWKKDHWVTLFDDILESYEKKRKHFFGFMTFYKPDRENEVQIIEGQQRLATITILASVVRDIFYERSDGRWEEVNARYITNKVPLYPAEKASDKIVLSEVDRHFFKEHVQTPGKPREKIADMEMRKPRKTSNKLLRDCYKYFYDKLRNQHLILELLHKATQEFIVITMDVGNLNSAYILFQTLNDRGLDLALSDLLKTHLMQTGGESSADIKREWDDISNLEITNMDVFLRHYWLSKYGTVKKEELFDKFSSLIKNEEDANKFIGKLKMEAETYSVLLDPKPSDFKGNKEIPRLLNDELYVLSKEQVLPLLLSLKQSRQFGQKEIIRFVESLTSLIFRYLTIGERENKELEHLFSDIAINIREDKISSAAQVVDKLRKLYIKDEEFQPIFKNKQIKERDSRKARYILFKIEKYVSKQEEKVPPPEITLEHILPINPSEPCKKEMKENGLWDDKDELVHRLGNMTLLLLPRNVKGRNDSPVSKSRDIYSESTLKINEDLKNIARWTDKEIDRRQAKFANYATNIWKL